jgi:hypothetical protein
MSMIIHLIPLLVVVSDGNKYSYMIEILNDNFIDACKL